MYFVNEDNVSVQAKLILSDPSSRDITVQVDAINNNATGKLWTLDLISIFMMACKTNHCSINCA